VGKVLQGAGVHLHPSWQKLWKATKAFSEWLPTDQRQHGRMCSPSCSRLLCSRPPFCQVPCGMQHISGVWFSNLDDCHGPPANEHRPTHNKSQPQCYQCGQPIGRALRCAIREGGGWWAAAVRQAVVSTRCRKSTVCWLLFDRSKMIFAMVCFFISQVQA